MEEKNNNKKLICLITILIVIILGLIGFIIYDNFFLNGKSINENYSSSTEIENISNRTNENIVASELYKLITNVNACKSGLEWNFENKNIIDINTTDEETKFAIVGNYLRDNDKLYETTKTNSAGEYYLMITKQNLDEAFHYIFGEKNSINYISEFILDYYGFVKTNENSYEGDIQIYDCHGATNFDTFLYDYKTISNGFELYVKYAYLPDQEGEEEIYYYDSKDNEICNEKDIEKNIDKLETYKYTFKIENSHYIFDTVEKTDYKK